MKYYLKLQLTLINRELNGIGINPKLGYVVLVFLFISLSNLFFQKVIYPEYFYIVFTLSILVYLNGKRRNDFLKLLSKNNDYLKIRIVENSIITLPFEIFLIYKHQLLPVIILLFSSSLLVFYTNRYKLLITLPTPFYKKPFEFNIGFRSQFLIIIFCYFLTLISVYVRNFNLGLFSLLLLEIIITTFYYKPEEKFFVWIFNQSSKKFLLDKIRTSIIYSLILCLPITILLITYNPEPKLFLTILGIQLFGILFITTSLLGKYSSFPSVFNPVQIFSVVFCVFFPPILILVIPFLYLKSVEKLKYILEC
jgi:hypothetical protein